MIGCSVEEEVAVIHYFLSIGYSQRNVMSPVKKICMWNRSGTDKRENRKSDFLQLKSKMSVM